MVPPFLDQVAGTGVPASPPTGILLRLRTETRAAHDRLEREVGLEDRLTTLSGYRHLLARMWGVYAPLERRLIDLHLQTSLPVDLAPRLKSPLLLADLTTLGVDPSSLPLMQPIPCLSGIAEAMGCLYVLEGATLGGRIIGDHVETALGAQSLGALTFVSSYGPDVGRMWRTFRLAISACAVDADSEDRLIASACTTFEAFEFWLREDR